eukprot:679807-Amphidinium_carterae.1
MPAVARVRRVPDSMATSQQLSAARVAFAGGVSGSGELTSGAGGSGVLTSGAGGSGELTSGAGGSGELTSGTAGSGEVTGGAGGSGGGECLRADFLGPAMNCSMNPAPVCTSQHN